MLQFGNPRRTLKRVLVGGWSVFDSALMAVPAMAWFVLPMQVFVGIASAFEPDSTDPLALAPLAFSASLTLALYLTVDGLVPSTRPRLLVVANTARSAGLLSLAAVRLTTGQSPDFFFVADHVRELFYPESLAMLFSSVAAVGWCVGLNALAGICVASLFVPLFRAIGPKRRWLAALSCFFATAVVLSPFYPQADATFLVRSAIDYGLGVHSQGELSLGGGYPYVQLGSTENQQATPGPRPHIFILLLESFNAGFVEKRLSDGREYTPVFNRLVNDGVYVEHFYGNSIQTAPGQQATLLSLIPTYRAKMFTAHPTIRVQSVAAILKRAGYNTYYLQGQPSIEFDNAHRFLPHIGFDEVYEMEGPFISNEDADKLWGWGLQHDRLYAKVFEFLDKCADNTSEFTVIQTASHHWPFNRLPSDRQFLYDRPLSRRQRFANSLHLADKYLAAFFDELQRRPRFAGGLVFVLGDHSFPAGEHDNHFNEKGFYEDNFRTPLLVLWPDKLVPKRVESPAYSQLDIGPTILDLLKLGGAHHFQGRSIISGSADAVAIPLVQPYDGTYLCSVRYPFKYVQRQRAPGEYLFNLTEDPAEQHNLMDRYRGTELCRAFQRDVDAIHLSQRLVERNRIWPLGPE